MACVRAALSLPPHVPGELQGWLYAELREVDMDLDGLLGALEWWGEDTAGSILLQVGASGGDGARSVAFPIKSSPRHFMAYLQDMEFLEIHLYQAFKPIGLCEIHLLPYIRGSDSDYELRLDDDFQVLRSASDRMALGRLRVCLRTEWAPQAELRSKQAVLSILASLVSMGMGDDRLMVLLNCNAVWNVQEDSRNYDYDSYYYYYYILLLLLLLPLLLLRRRRRRLLLLLLPVHTFVHFIDAFRMRISGSLGSCRACLPGGAGVLRGPRVASEAGRSRCHVSAKDIHLRPSGCLV